MIVRGLLVVSLLIWLVTLDDVFSTLLLSLLCIFVLCYQGFGFINFKRAFYALAWFVLPILVLHGFFTPGTMVQYPFYLPMSEEGLLRGLSLSAQIGAVFFSALVISRLFTKDEWLSFIDCTGYGAAMKPFIYLIAEIRSEMMSLLAEQKKTWLNMQNRWLKLPSLLVLVIQQMVYVAKSEASHLWHDWDVTMLPTKHDAVQYWSSKDAMYLIAVTLGWLSFWMV
ncbi:MAG TPA: hypothetical protein EYP39_06620 [Ghiorsea sp.]|nr:hypothetical protein [Ghiorsea sp.]HIP07412.1 hypothetical protein [Mariprofundaceae bacterium]